MRLLRRVAAYFRSKSAIHEKLLLTKVRLRLREEHIELLNEQVSGYRDAFLAIQFGYSADGARAKGALENMRETRDG